MRAQGIEKLRAKRVAELRRKSERLEEAFIYERSINQPTYERQRDRIEKELKFAELELHEARIESIDVEGILGFAENLLANAGRAWMEANLEHRQQIQSAIFPEGLPFDGKDFGTAPTCLAFKQLEESDATENRMASLIKIREPVPIGIGGPKEVFDPAASIQGSSRSGSNSECLGTHSTEQAHHEEDWSKFNPPRNNRTTRRRSS